MNPNQYQSNRQSGPTGSIHRSGVSGYSGQSGMGGTTDKKWGDTTSKAGEIARVFVGSVDYKSTTCNDIEQRFGKYGNITGVDIHQNNFAFIQFERVEEAQGACACENGSFFKTRKIDVRLFDKSKPVLRGRPDRSRSPAQRNAIGPTGTRHGSVLPNQFDDPYAYPPVPSEPVIGNEAEIIVVNKDQWSYADMIEKRVKRETGIQYIDMLFLHSPTSLNMTLNDLFERRTLYALVIAPVNEEHMSVTLHVLHNQTEHRNMPLDDALLLISKDFQAFTGRKAPAIPPAAPYAEPSFSADKPLSAYEGQNRNESLDSKLPEEVSYLLRTVLQENGPQFLSITQIDLLIDYFERQKSKMVSNNAAQVANTTSAQQQSSEFDKQKANLLDNPHVQAALTSLLNIGALGSTNNSDSNNQNNNQSNNSYSMGGQYSAQTQNNSSASAPTRRHPLMGTELAANKPQMSIPGAPGGLVGYPPPQSYNQYSYRF